jgi:hypothetical protein
MRRFERDGFEWWNSISEAERAWWVGRAGFGSSVADAYRQFLREKAQQERIKSASQSVSNSKRSCTH